MDNLNESKRNIILANSIQDIAIVFCCNNKLSRSTQFHCQRRNSITDVWNKSVHTVEVSFVGNKDKAIN